MDVSRPLVAAALAGAGLALAGCGSLTGAACSSPSGPGPRREADAYIRDLVQGGRKAVAGHSASYADYAYERGRDAEASVGCGRMVRRLLKLARRAWQDPLLAADYVEQYQQGPRRGRRSTPGRYLRLPGVEKDAVLWPPKEGASRTARTSVTATRWRG